jgi:hypothetical protein
MNQRVQDYNASIRNRLLQNVKDRQAGRTDKPVFEKFNKVTGGLTRESLTRSDVDANLKKRAEDYPKKMVLKIDPETGNKMYVERRERESNAFITLNTHQKPEINKDEKSMEALLKLVINKLFSEAEMQKWVEIKEPYLGQGDVFTLDHASESSIFKSLRILPGIEIGPINKMLHAHIIVELTHYSMLRYNSELFGKRAAELWRSVAPADLRPEPKFDIEIKDLIDAVKEELSIPNAIKKDFHIDNAVLYGSYGGAKTEQGIPRNKAHRRGLHKISAINKLKAFIKSRPNLRNTSGKRSDIERHCRQHIIAHMEELTALQNTNCQFTKNMYCNIQITQSNSVNHRMNYIQKTQAHGENVA